MAEMAAVLNCSPDTLQRRFAAVIEKGRERGKSSLKRAQWKKAVDEGNPTMLIWLGKQHLGQTDKTQVDQQSITDTARQIKEALDTIDGDVLYEH
jgi:AraC-like DNA-binding protein